MLLAGGGHLGPDLVCKKSIDPQQHYPSQGSDLRQPPPPGYLKANFDVAIRPNFAVAAATLSDSSGSVISACSKKLLSLDVLRTQ